MEKKVVSFDLDGTLIGCEFGDLVWNEGIPLEYAKKYRIPVEEAKRIVISEYESVGEGSILWYDINYWIKRFGLPLDAQELLDRYRGSIRLLEGVKEALEMLRNRFLLVVCSNASRIFVEKELKETGIEGFFAYVFSATSDFRMVKKERDFYIKVMEILAVRPNEMVHIGDHPIFDFEVPSSLGIESYLVKRESEIKEILAKL